MLHLIKYPLDETVKRFFEGAAARGFEMREGQMEMANEICTAITEKRPLAVEAEVGIGKSFAYLVPALIQYFRERRQVIIATSTIALQEQLYWDAQTVLKMLGVHANIILAKGMKNYACMKRVHSLYSRHKNAMPCVSLQIENKGNTFDEDIDVKLFIEQGCLAGIDDITEPGLFFLEEAVELKVPKALFCGHSDEDIEDYSNYPIIPYVPQTFSNPFKSDSEEIEEQREEYQEMMENVFCFDLRGNNEDDILCFNIPYLKQNTKMFFPSYLFFKKIPKNLRYEIRSKHSPEVYKGMLELADEEDEN